MKTGRLGRRGRWAIAWVVLAMSAGRAAAATIDFTDYNVWGGADGAGRYEGNAGGVAVTVGAEPGAADAVLRHSSAGLGVDMLAVGDQLAHQVDSRESLSLSFDQAVTVDAVYVANFYSWGFGQMDFQVEQGSYVYEGDGQAGGDRFRANSPSGVRALVVDSPPITRITFASHIDLETETSSSFSLAGLSFTLPDMATGKGAVVPELDPSSSASGLCLAFGALLLGQHHWRRRR